MKTLVIASIAGLVLAACAPVPPADGGGPPVVDGPDQCRASQYQYLVGRQRSEIPAEPTGARWRVTCTTCPVTMDYSPGRLNILYDSQSNIVREVKCG